MSRLSLFVALAWFVTLTACADDGCKARTGDGICVERANGNGVHG